MKRAVKPADLPALTLDDEPLMEGKMPRHIKRRLAEAIRVAKVGSGDTAILQDGEVVAVLIPPEKWHPDDAPPEYPEPGSEIPPEKNGGMAGYVVGYCTHRVAASEWAAGFRNCERCHG